MTRTRLPFWTCTILNQIDASVILEARRLELTSHDWALGDEKITIKSIGYIRSVIYHRSSLETRLSLDSRPSLDRRSSLDILGLGVLLLSSGCFRASSPSWMHSSTSLPPIPFSFHDSSNFLGMTHSLRACAILPSLTRLRILSGVARTCAASSLVRCCLASVSRFLPWSESGAGTVSRRASRIEDA